MLLSLIRELSKNQPKHKILEDNKYKLTIECNNSNCSYIKIKKSKKSSSTGYLNFLNGSLYELYDEESGTSFKIIDKKQIKDK